MILVHHDHAILQMLMQAARQERFVVWPARRRQDSENSKANRDRSYERSGGIWRNLFGWSRRIIAKKVAKNKCCYANSLRPRITPWVILGGGVGGHYPLGQSQPPPNFAPPCRGVVRCLHSNAFFRYYVRYFLRPPRNKFSQIPPDLSPVLILLALLFSLHAHHTPRIWIATGCKHVQSSDAGQFDIL
jgi:hypothetical protein